VLTMTLRCKSEIQQLVALAYALNLPASYALNLNPLCHIEMNQSGPGIRSIVYLPSATMRPDSKISKGSSSSGTDVRTITSETADNVFVEFLFLESVVVLENI
jgi:hypothetical protein